MTEHEITQIISEIRAVAKKTDSIYQGLYGIPDTDDNGLCGELNTLKKDYYEFKRRVLIAASFLIGSGLLGLGIFKAAGG